MKKNHKIIIGIIIAVLAISVAVLAGQSELFQGKIKFYKRYPTGFDTSRVFWYQGKIVSAVTSPVTSPVPSVVISDVTSPAGTSRVASVVTSPVASPVASAVTVDEKTASKIDTKRLSPKGDRFIYHELKLYANPSPHVSRIVKSSPRFSASSS